MTPLQQLLALIQQIKIDQQASVEQFVKLRHLMVHAIDYDIATDAAKLAALRAAFR